MDGCLVVGVELFKVKSNGLEQEHNRGQREGGWCVGAVGVMEME